MIQEHRISFSDIELLIHDAYIAIAQAFNEEVNEKQLRKEITAIIKKEFKNEVEIFR